MKIISHQYEVGNRDYRFVATLKYHEKSFTIHRESWIEHGTVGQYAWVPYTVMCSIELHELEALISMLTRFKKLLNLV